MKQKFAFAFALILIINSSCYSQKMMQTINDAHKLKENAQMFEGKPLSILLKEIKPKIKSVSANPSKNPERLGYIIFRFVDTKSYDSLRVKNKYAKQITVFVKEAFEWDLNNRGKRGLQSWTQNDENLFGNLTVVAIRVFGEN